MVSEVDRWAILPIADAMNASLCNTVPSARCTVWLDTVQYGWIHGSDPDDAPWHNHGDRSLKG